MALVLGLWLALIGYTVAWSGWRNLGITYTAQPNGSLTASQPAVSLLDAFTGREPAPAAASSNAWWNALAPAQQAAIEANNAALQGAAVTGQAVLGATNRLAGGGGQGAGPPRPVDRLARGLVQVVDNVGRGTRGLVR
jgi:hypothetical protein